MTTQSTSATGAAWSIPQHLGLYYGGGWHEAKSGRSTDTFNPSTGETICSVQVADAADVDAAIAAARRGFVAWRAVAPLERARLLRKAAAILREHGDELAMLDAANCGNPVHEMKGDVGIAAAQLEFFAGL